ncbi:glutamate racemase [Rhodococcus triatomae]|uniref:Glutamate racemase n=1 Tax=Rhodococcus triatomae TaxID=300028 RepID=A0A1G8JHV0_9NOCA|nr:aspartate/glutamate racemase family protein [Rhodococcus triatomae]QNG19711.1 glutamate racemase [Rhodococcus triatomae]QNG24373.1 glutamate racemase [Rhodococcus triatomae]SDI30854.1 glutamate racemase [Rhodococcus triatomae]
MIVALIDSGLGLLPTSAWLRKLRPDLDLLLALDPDQAPWGPKPREWVVDRVLGAVQLSLDHGAEAIVLPCNTASVSALDEVRDHVGPAVPVIGTVPAIKPAAARYSSVAIWATATTTASSYQADLIRKFGNGSSVSGVACHGLADSIDRGDLNGVDDAVRAAALATPAGTEAVVLGCTHYPLVADVIAARLPEGVALFDSAEAVAAQTIRRIDAIAPAGPGTGTVRVFLSGRPGRLPASADRFEAGRLLS